MLYPLSYEGLHCDVADQRLNSEGISWVASMVVHSAFGCAACASSSAAH